MILSVPLSKTGSEMAKHQSAFVESSKERDQDLGHSYFVEVIRNLKLNS